MKTTDIRHKDTESLMNFPPVKMYEFDTLDVWFWSQGFIFYIIFIFLNIEY